ncbi:hypothetical protein SGLAM104S_05116 [Streptomyces glaucescens]
MAISAASADGVSQPPTAARGRAGGVRPQRQASGTAHSRGRGTAGPGTGHPRRGPGPGPPSGATALPPPRAGRRRHCRALAPPRAGRRRHRGSPHDDGRNTTERLTRRDDPSDLLARAQAWLTEDPDPETRDELAGLIDAHDVQELTARFGGTLQFGTAGLRGELSAPARCA